MKFRKLVLKNWKNFTDVEIDIPNRLFLVGPNASGKSNFLDVFRFLRDLVTTGGGLQWAVVDKRGGVNSIRCLASRQRPDIEVAVEMEANDGIKWVYELAFNQGAQRRAQIKKERVLRNDTTLLDRPNAEDQEDPEQLTQTYLEQVNANYYFREIATFFASIRYMHIVPQFVRAPDRLMGRSNDPFGSDFLEQIVNIPEKIQSERLKRINIALRIAIPQLDEIKLERDERGTPHLLGKYQHWKSKKVWQNEKYFSDGTLRLMSLLWTAMENGGPLLLEEPELSLHPEVARDLPQIMAFVRRSTDRQIFMSTYCMDMLHNESIRLNEVLLFIPGKKGTEVKTAASQKDICDLLDGGLSLADIVVQKTQPCSVIME